MKYFFLINIKLRVINKIFHFCFPEHILHPIVTTQNSDTLLTDREIGGLAL